MAFIVGCPPLGFDDRGTDTALGRAKVSIVVVLPTSDADQSASAQYRSVKDEWWGVPEVFDRADVVEVNDRLHSRKRSHTHIMVAGAA